MALNWEKKIVNLVQILQRVSNLYLPKNPIIKDKYMATLGS